MSISEAQLDTWAKPGNQVQSANTYGTIKPIIENRDSPYSGRDISSHLQGSYGNDTNVFGLEADVDIVLQSGAVYYPDLHKLSPEQKALYEQGRSGASYSVEQFKVDVTGWLRKQFPGQVDPGAKAITIKGTENRRKADVLACCDYYRFFTFFGFGDPRTRIEKGVCASSCRTESSSATSRSSIERIASPSRQRPKTTSSRWCGSSRTCAIG